MARIEYQNRTQALSLDQERMLNERDLIAPADTHAESMGDVYIVSGGHSWAEVDAALDEHGMITDEEKKAALRFWETSEDGEGYDVPQPMMKRLAVLGLVVHKGGGWYEGTPALEKLQIESEPQDSN